MDLRSLGVHGRVAFWLASTVTCDGSDSVGASKCSLPEQKPHPVSLTGIGPVLALFSDGSVQCWGPNAYGRCATGFLSPEFRVPVLSTELTCIAQLSDGVAVDDRGKVYVWGDDRDGQRGGARLLHFGEATVVEGVRNPLWVSGYGSNVYAIDTQSTVLWWGSLAMISSHLR